MKTYYYNNYKLENGVIVNFVSSITEDEILKNYYKTWCDRMTKVQRTKLINKENCIHDWVVDNYAWSEYVK